MERFSISRIASVICYLVVANALMVTSVSGDGKVIRPRNYKGSLEEKSQEAILIFNGGEKRGDATQDMILKISVTGEAKNFAWVIPFPNEPEVKKEDPKLFEELFSYVESRKARRTYDSKREGVDGAAKNSAQKKTDVEVLSRKLVGDFEILTVKETKAGALNPWLEKEGFQPLENAEDVIGFYRDKGFVFCCIKVQSEILAKEKKIDSHPLRFSFKTGGQDGVFFPMKMTGLQQESFDINLYVFYRYWINDKLNKFGYMNRGFELYFRDFDTRECVSNGGKAYSLPESDPYLKAYARRIPTVTKLFQKLHPGKKYYLTNIKARNLKPEDVRDWSDDLWMFPYYTDKSVVPYDVQDDGPASGAWPNEKVSVGNAWWPVEKSRRPNALAWGLVAAGVLVASALFMRVTNCCRQDKPPANDPWKKFD